MACNFSEGHKVRPGEREFGVTALLNIWLSNIKRKCAEELNEGENCPAPLPPPTHSWSHPKAECLELPDICLAVIAFLPG